LSLKEPHKKENHARIVICRCPEGCHRAKWRPFWSRKGEGHLVDKTPLEREPGTQTVSQKVVTTRTLCQQMDRTDRRDQHVFACRRRREKMFSIGRGKGMRGGGTGSRRGVSRQESNVPQILNIYTARPASVSIWIDPKRQVSPSVRERGRRELFFSSCSVAKPCLKAPPVRICPGVLLALVAETARPWKLDISRVCFQFPAPTVVFSASETSKILHGAPPSGRSIRTASAQPRGFDRNRTAFS